MNFLDCFFLAKPHKLNFFESYGMSRRPSEDTREYLNSPLQLNTTCVIHILISQFFATSENHLGH